jgi:hypothetical protein
MMGACGLTAEEFKSITAQLIRVRDGLDATTARAAAENAVSAA